MKKVMILMTMVCLIFASAAFAGENPVAKEVRGALEEFAAGCEAELTTYCQDATPGEGRVMACLYAFSDKLSPSCEYALYTSMDKLHQALTSVAHAVGECRDDLNSHCADIKPGEGRLLDCLKANEARVSERCITALKDVGWMK